MTGEGTPVEFKTSKSAQTYSRVLRAAVELFCEVGFEKATMRAIAERGELGLGALYYYFPSKEAVVLAFYRELNEELAREFRSRREPDAPLSEQLSCLLTLKLERLKPYRPFLKVILKEAVDPDSALSPLAGGSRETLDTSLELFREMLELDGSEREQAARLLWFGHLAVLAYWLHTDDRLAGEAAELLVEMSNWMGLAWLSSELSPLRERFFRLMDGLFPQ